MTLSNVSVQSAANKTLEDLSVYIPNNQVGKTTVGAIQAAGGEVNPSPRPGNPYHADIFRLTAEKLQNLFQPTVQNSFANDNI